MRVTVNPDHPTCLMITSNSSLAVRLADPLPPLFHGCADPALLSTVRTKARHLLTGAPSGFRSSSHRVQEEAVSFPTRRHCRSGPLGGTMKRVASFDAALSRRHGPNLESVHGCQCQLR